MRAAKLLMADKNFEGEFTTLLHLAMGIAGADNAGVEENAVRGALRELLVAFPVYRTYGTTAGLPPEGGAVAKIVQRVKAARTRPIPVRSIS